MPGAIPYVATVGMMVISAAKISTWAKIFAYVTIGLISHELSEEIQPDEFTPPRGIELQQNMCTTGISLPLVYGEVKIGGDDVFMGVSGTDNKYLHIVQVLGEGECQGIKTIPVIGPGLFIDDLSHMAHEVEYGGGLIDYTFHNGASDQTYDAYLQSVFSDFTDNMRNTCYIRWRFTYDAKAFHSIPKRIIVLEGRKVWLPDGTKAYSNNAAAVLYDYLRSPHCAYGLGGTEYDQLSVDEIDHYSYLASYNYCDQSSKGWEFNGAIFHEEMARDVIDRMRKHFRGSLRWRDGCFYFKYKDLNEETPAMALTEAHIARDQRGKAIISVSQPGASAAFDGLRVSFINTTSNIYSEDNVLVGEEEGTIKDLDLVGYNSRELAGAMGSYYLERARDPYDRIISGTFRDDCQQLERDDLITLTYDDLGYSSQYMRVISTTRRPDGLVNLVLQLEHADLYNDEFDVATESAYECEMPDPEDFDPVNAPDNIIELDDDDFDSNNEYTLAITDLGKTFVVTSNNDLTILMPSIDSDQIGERVKFIHYGTGKLTLQFADSDTGDNSSAGGYMWHQEWP